jgi:hypothetical protein
MMAGRASADEWRLLLQFIPSLRASDRTRENWASDIKAWLASQVTFERLASGWRIGQGDVVRIFSDDLVPAGMAEAHAAFLAGVRPSGDDAPRRMRFIRVATWMEQIAGAPLLAAELRRLRSAERKRP